MWRSKGFVLFFAVPSLFYVINAGPIMDPFLSFSGVDMTKDIFDKVGTTTKGLIDNVGTSIDSSMRQVNDMTGKIRGQVISLAGGLSHMALLTPSIRDSPSETPPSASTESPSAALLLAPVEAPLAEVPPIEALPSAEPLLVEPPELENNKASAPEDEDAPAGQVAK